MTLAPELDPYILPFPAPDSPVVSAHIVKALHAHLNARYADPVWPLAPLTENPSGRKASIRWKHCPDVFQDEVRLAAWTMINGQLRPTFIQERSGRTRARLGITSLGDTVMEWMRLATWLADRGIHSLATCDSAVLHDYGHHLRDTGVRRKHAQFTLGALTRLWAFDQLSNQPTGIGRPPWDENGVDDYLPAASTSPGGGENNTDALAEQTMGPLLIWAMRMVDDFADDILSAWGETKRLTEVARTARANQAGKQALLDFLMPLITSKAPLPTTTFHGKPTLARYYIGGLTGASEGHIQEIVRRERLRELATQRPGPCPLDVPVKGRIAGKPWRTALDYSEPARLMRHLGTACFIVIAFLTGMRPGEILGLRTGCCPDPEPDSDGKTSRHLIRGQEFKTAVDEHGNHRSGGVEREVPWVAIAPVVNAIRVLERIVPPGHLLFDHNAHDLRQLRAGTGSLKGPAMRGRIEDFIAWANAEATAHDLPTQIIPPDPHGKVGIIRFRRSLAWHIARRPGGLVALAIQYGHLRTMLVSEGYASRSRDGIHELINIETVRAVVDTVADLHDDLIDGGGLSGPAARRTIKAAATAPRFAGVTITATTAGRLVANEDVMIHDNPQALLLCHYKRAQALCHRDGVRDAPRLDHCVPDCGNISRTDQHAAQLRDRAEAMENRAALAPRPIADRLRTNATKLRGMADHHDRNRIILQEAST